MLGRLGRDLSLADGLNDQANDAEAAPALKRQRSIGHIYTTEEAASIVQNLFRRKRAREMLLQAIKSVHARFETEGGDSYYFNKLTRQVTWTKPKLLSKLNRQLSLSEEIDDAETGDEKSLKR